MLTPKERYLTDPMFHNLVEILYREIKAARYTPSELREAVIFAAIIYEQERPFREVIDDAYSQCNPKDNFPRRHSDNE